MDQTGAHTDAGRGGIEIAPGVRVFEADLRFTFVRSSGPGGQNVNKLNTKAELRLPLAALVGLTDGARDRLARLAGRRLTSAGDLLMSADTSRSQERNREAVLERLRVLIVQAMHEPKRRRKTRPSRASRQRRLQSKRQRSQIKSQRRGPVAQ